MAFQPKSDGDGFERHGATTRPRVNSTRNGAACTLSECTKATVGVGRHLIRRHEQKASNDPNWLGLAKYAAGVRTWYPIGSTRNTGGKGLLRMPGGMQLRDLTRNGGRSISVAIVTCLCQLGLSGSLMKSFVRVWFGLFIN